MVRRASSSSFNCAGRRLKCNETGSLPEQEAIDLHGCSMGMQPTPERAEEKENALLTVRAHCQS